MFKNFALGNLFEASTGDVDLQIKDVNGNGHLLINSGVTNRGIKGKTDKPARIFSSNTITIDFWGNAYYRDFEYKMATHNHVFSLSGKILRDKYVGLYIESLLAKLPQLFSYDHMATWNELKDIEISLPIIASPDPYHAYTIDDINWGYMQDRIKELEQDRIKELDIYLKATGLDSCDLTNEDDKALSAKKVYKDFIMQDVFHKRDLKCVKTTFVKERDICKERTQEFNLPLVNAKNGSNGVMYYGRYEDWESDTYCIDIVNDGAVSTGNVYAQPQRTGILYNAYLIKPNTPIESESVLLYLAKCIEKAIKSKFGYDNKAIWDKVKLMKISLPVVESSDPNHVYTVNDIDFDYMERYIRSIKKLVIADVVEYKNKAIETTKQIVES